MQRPRAPSMTPAARRARSPGRGPARSSRASCRSRPSGPRTMLLPSARNVDEGAATESWRSKQPDAGLGETATRATRSHPATFIRLSSSLHYLARSRSDNGREAGRSPPRARRSRAAYGSSGMRSTGSRTPLATTGKLCDHVPVQVVERRPSRHASTSWPSCDSRMLRLIFIVATCAPCGVEAEDHCRSPHTAGRRCAPSCRTVEVRVSRTPRWRSRSSCRPR